jgi:DNA polymerase-3 subunit alpha
MRAHPGKSRLKFVFHDRKNAATVTLTTMDKGFEMNDEMASFLSENPDLETVVETT